MADTTLWKTRRSPARRSTVASVRWERLFDDLEAQLEAERHAETVADLTDLIRAERAGLTLSDRLRGQLGAELGWCLRGTHVFDAELVDVGADWLLLRRGVRQELVVSLEAVIEVRRMARSARQDPGAVARRLGIGSVLRRLARDRAEVGVRLAGGTVPAEEVVGTIDRVGADHFDLAEHPAGSPRRPGAVIRVRTLRFAALVWVSAETS